MKKKIPEEWIFIFFLLFAGILHTYDAEIPGSFLETVFFCLITAIYAGLLLAWMQSVYVRLLPSRSRTYILASALLFLIFLILRTCKYRILLNDSIEGRCCWYGYYLPVLFVPTLFLMCSIRMTSRGQKVRLDERVLLIPALCIWLGIMTNEAHFLAFRPLDPQAGFTSMFGTYTHGVLFYIAYSWAGLAVVAGLAVLILPSGKTESWKAGLLSFLMLFVIMPALIVLGIVMKANDIQPLYVDPEIEIFCALAAYEICIRSHLLPANTNYTGFFSKMKFPAMITDRSLTEIYATATPLRAGQAQLLAAQNGPVYLNGELRLSSMTLDGGYSFFEEDISELVRMNQKLASANEILDSENALIHAEREAGEKKARLDAQNRIYDRIAETLYPRQQEIKRLLDACLPGTEEFKPAMAKCLFLSAYCKRRSNLILLTETTVPEVNRELFLALQESCRYLRYCGVDADVAGLRYASFPLAAICDLYDSFETITEALLPVTKQLLVSLTDTGMKMMLEAPGPVRLPEAALPAEVREAEGCLYITIPAEGGIAP